jgi:hypothetical protein
MEIGDKPKARLSRYTLKVDFSAHSVVHADSGINPARSLLSPPAASAQARILFGQEKLCLAGRLTNS